MNSHIMGRTGSLIAWRIGDLGVLILNSIFYAGIPTVLTVYLALAAGYAVAKFGFKVSKTLYAFFMMIVFYILFREQLARGFAAGALKE
jgi:ABC-type Fe3+ transport system permease subunit